MSNFLMPTSAVDGLYKDKGSKFYAYLFPVSSEEEVKRHILKLKYNHKKARHFCYAFSIGIEAEFERCNDDGEPSGSAGLPILNQLHSAQLSNACIIVVRYFGGTKLGMSGLIKAYKESAKEVISYCKSRPLIQQTIITIEFPISAIGDVERCVISHEANLTGTTYGEKCVFIIEIREEASPKLIEALEAINNVSISI